MARILPHYSLCPLIEQKNFLGLIKEIEDDVVLVTANSNIIGRYQVSDPKLLSSWNSKGSITAACVHDSKLSRYIAVFNQNEIRIWTSREDNIDKVKKYKFTEKLFQLLISPVDQKIILVFFNGNAYYLDDVIEDRKNAGRKTLIACDQKLLSCSAVRFGNELITTNFIEEPRNSISLIGVSLEKRDIVFSVPLTFKQNVKLRGYCLFADRGCHLFTFWSNGKLCRDSVYPSNVLIPNNCVLIIDNIDLKQNVNMKVLSPYYLAICGKKDDGILLMIYSIKYNLIQGQEFYENCNTVPRLWVVGSKLFLISGHNLVVVPYVQENRKLSSLLGSSSIHMKNTVENELSELELYCKVLPEILRNDDFEGVLKVVRSGCDLSDSSVIEILIWCLKKKSKGEKVLDIILFTRSVSDLNKIRTTFDIDLTLSLLDFIMERMNIHLSNTKLFKWISLFTDAFYSQFIMSNDPVIFEKLQSYRNFLSKELDCSRQYKILSTALTVVERQKVNVK